MGKRNNENGIYWRWLDDCAAQIIRMHWLRVHTLQGAARSLEMSPDQLRRIIRRLQTRGLLPDLPSDARTLDGKPIEDDKDDDEPEAEGGEEAAVEADAEPGATGEGSNG